MEMVYQSIGQLSFGGNQDQVDGDRDGLGGVCDDLDGDGFTNEVDNCPNLVTVTKRIRMVIVLETSVMMI